MKRLITILILLFSTSVWAADVDRGYTYPSDGTVTNNNLHQLVDSATVTNIDQPDMAASRGIAVHSTSTPTDTDAVWIDTNTTPPIVKVYDGSDWVEIPVSDSSVAQGAILYYDGSQWVDLVAGTSGYLLQAQGAGANPQWAAAGGTPNLTLSTTNSAGSATTYIRTDDTILTFDATSPSSIDVGDSASAGSASVAARRDHQHALGTLSSSGANDSISDNNLIACGSGYDNINTNVTVTATAAPVIVSVIMEVRYSSSGDDGRFRIDRDDGVATSAAYDVIDVDVANTGVAFTWIDVPGAGSTTYNVQGCTSSGTGVIVDALDFGVAVLP